MVAVFFQFHFLDFLFFSFLFFLMLYFFFFLHFLHIYFFLFLVFVLFLYFVITYLFFLVFLLVLIIPFVPCFFSFSYILSSHFFYSLHRPFSCLYCSTSFSSFSSVNLCLIITFFLFNFASSLFSLLTFSYLSPLFSLLFPSPTSLSHFPSSLPPFLFLFSLSLFPPSPPSPA